MSYTVANVIDANAKGLLDEYRRAATVLLLLGKDAPTDLLSDPPSPERDKLIELSKLILKQQLALLKTLDEIQRIAESRKL